MPKYKKSNSTAKAGVNYVRSIVEAQGCIFHKIEQDNDLGIDALLELIRDADSIPPVLIYFFAHVPWHGDICSVGEGLTDETREYVRKKHFKAFGAAEVIKLLEYVDEAAFSRGALGQSVEAIISSLPQRCSLLEAILEDNSQPIEIREHAALIYAMHEPEKALLHMGKLNSEESEWMGELIAHIKEFGAFNPYC